MAQVTIIGLDLAKNVFQAHGASETGMVVLGRAPAAGHVWVN